LNPAVAGSTPADPNQCSVASGQDGRILFTGHWQLTAGHSSGALAKRHRACLSNRKSRVRLPYASLVISRNYRGVVAPMESACLASRRLWVQTPSTPLSLPIAGATTGPALSGPVVQRLRRLSYKEDIAGSSPAGITWETQNIKTKNIKRARPVPGFMFYVSCFMFSFPGRYPSLVKGS
jgi:hypothetical protein